MFVLITILLGIFISVYILYKISQNNTKVFLSLVCLLACFGIVCAVVSFYAQNGFDLYSNLFFLFPLYVFLIWAIYKTIKMLK